MQESEFPDDESEQRKNLQKRPFKPHEDQIIVSHILKNGPKNWAIPAKLLPGRTPKQCRERWHNHLDPSINKGPWKFNEDLILARKQKELGNRWADIAKFLPGRTDTLVKNRWNTSVKSRANELLGVCPVNCNSNQLQQYEVSQWLESISSSKIPKLPQIINEMPLIPPLLQRKN